MPSAAAIAEIRQLNVREHLHLLIWLDEQERYFEAVECWLGIPVPGYPACAVE